MIEASIRKIIAWPTSQQPMLVVVVDTEAEFDWIASGSRRAAGVTAVKALQLIRPIFERYNVRPTFVLDYPVSTIPEGYEVIRDVYQDGFCEVGAHLQPWDTPPLVEDINDRNSYPAILPPKVNAKSLFRRPAPSPKISVFSPAFTKPGDTGS